MSVVVIGGGGGGGRLGKKSVLDEADDRIACASSLFFDAIAVIDTDDSLSCAAVDDSTGDCFILLLPSS